MVRENIMIHNRSISGFPDFVYKRLCLLTDILSLQKRYRCQGFFGIRRFLIFQQGMGFLHNLLYLFAAEAFFQCCKLLCQYPVPFLGKAFPGRQGKNTFVRIFKHTFPDKFFKIRSFRFFPKLFIGFPCLNMDKRLCVII